MDKGYAFNTTNLLLSFVKHLKNCPMYFLKKATKTIYIETKCTSEDVKCVFEYNRLIKIH